MKLDSICPSVQKSLKDKNSWAKLPQFLSSPAPSAQSLWVLIRSEFLSFAKTFESSQSLRQHNPEDSIRSVASFAFCTTAMCTEQMAASRIFTATRRGIACWCSVLTLWRSESCWWRIRASSVGNCHRHSRQTILFQSVTLPSSLPVLSEPPSSAVVSSEHTTLGCDSRWQVNVFYIQNSGMGT